MDYQKFADMLFPHIHTTPEEIEARYPKRELPEGAKVTRIAPSPTGFMHLGNLYGAIVDERLAHQSGGVFYLRIEDTDQKRLVENGVEMIPLRVVAEALGFEVIWNNDERSVTLKKETFTSLITIGDENGGINRARILMQAKPVIKNDRTFVSMDYFKALEEALSI